MAAELPGTIGERHLPLRDQVLQALRQAIVDGNYEPGQRLTEERLAVDFGVSRNPIREALRVAETEGFVEVLPRRGAVVASPTSESLADIFVVRARLEPLAARLAAERATPADVAALRALLERARDATETEDFSAVADLNTRFHTQVIGLSGNRWLSAMTKPLYLHVQWVFRLGVTQRAPHSWHEHIALVDAIEAGDPDQAEIAAAGHVHAASAAAHARAGADPTGQG